MARTVEEIKLSITSAFVANPQVITYYGLESGKTFDEQFSKLSLESIIFSVIASAMFVVESLFDTHKTDIESKLAERMAHNKMWYKNKALAFQYGHSLVPESDYYEPIDTNAQIIKHASVDETDDGFLQIKVAKESEESLEALTETEQTAFTGYMAKVKDAGVNIRVISQEADHLRLVIDIYYDPIVLGETGNRLDGTNNSPVQQAISKYLENLPFNGEFTIMALTDALQAVNGVVVPQVLSADSYYGTADWVIITAIHQPHAGWMRVYDAVALGISVITTDHTEYITVEDGHLIINWRPYGG